MTDQQAIWLAHQRARFMRPDAARFMRPDAHRWIRPDVARFLKPGTNPADVFPALDRKYNPTQRRIPAGRTGGGRWTDEEGGGSSGSTGGFERGVTGDASDGNAEGVGEWVGYENNDEFGNNEETFENSEVFVADQTPDNVVDSKPPKTGNDEINDPRVISDADPETVKPGEQYAQAGGRRGGTTVRINGQTFELTVRQSAELQGVQVQAQGAIARVRELDPTWKPTPSEYQTVSGLIESYRADARQAQERASDLASRGIGTGPFAGESLPARDSGRNFTSNERRDINRIGSETGCQTCGTTIPGTPRGNFIIDHQPPSALNYTARAQRLYPQCLTCSLIQGGVVSGILRGY